MMFRTTAAQRARIVELRERNWTIEAIATEIGCSINTVQHWCLIACADPKVLPPERMRRVRPVMRAGRAVNPFTEEDDGYLLRMERQGLNYSQMSRRMIERFPERPRNPATIKYRLLTLARQEERRIRRAEQVMQKASGVPPRAAPRSPFRSTHPSTPP